MREYVALECEDARSITHEDLIKIVTLLLDKMDLSLYRVDPGHGEGPHFEVAPNYRGS